MADDVEVLLKHASVRVEDLGGELLGTGILLPWGESLAVLTCAHLLPAGPRPADAIKVSFQGERRGVRRVWLPDGVGESREPPYRKDLALLTPEAPLPGASPIPWTAVVPASGSAVWFHGFRAGQSNRETIRTRISAWNDEHGCLILQDAPARGTSGGPVCIEDGGRLHLVGMVVARVVDTASRGVVLPAATIHDALPADHGIALVPGVEPDDRPSQIRLRLLQTPGFADEYQLERVLAHGEHATVFLAKDVDLDREVVIKVLDPDASEAERGAFVRDVRIAARFEHPNVVDLLAATLRGPLPRFVMDFVDGPSLREQLELGDASFDAATAGEIIRQIGDALAYMHRQGFVHGNVSDGNILLDNRRPGRIRALISSFGVTPAGGPGVASATRRSMVDARTDQLFLGRVAHKLFAHAFPDDGPPPALAEVIMRMIDLVADRRFRSLDEAMDAFGRGLRNANLVPAAPTTGVRLGDWQAPEPPPADVIDRAAEAYERWRRLPRFFESFYETLFAKDPSVEERFSPQGRSEQPEKLRRALDMVLKFPRQRSGEEPLLEDIARTHSFRGAHKIPPHLYPVFESALLDTAARRDVAFDDRERQAWRAVLAYAFDFMQARYY